VPPPAKNNSFYQLIGYYNKFASEGLQIIGKEQKIKFSITLQQASF